MERILDTYLYLKLLEETILPAIIATIEDDDIDFDQAFCKYIFVF